MNQNLSSLLSLALLPSLSQGAIILSEFRSDQSGADNSEYFELSGNPGESLDGYFYLVIGDGAGGSGVVESVVDLTGSLIPADGYFLAGESTFENGVGETFEGITLDLVTSINFENGDNTTHVLVTGFTGVAQDDLDTNDDGTLDVTPWGTVVDSFQVIEELADGISSQEYSYDVDGDGESIGPDGTFVPAHGYRDASGTLTAGAFATGEADETPGAAPLAVPEPASALFAFLGLALGATRRKR